MDFEYVIFHMETKSKFSSKEQENSKLEFKSIIPLAILINIMIDKLEEKKELT